MQTVTVSTRKKEQVIDITDIVTSAVHEAGRESGVCVISVAHTTCALTTADLDPGTDQDLLQALRALLPQLHYRHPHDPEHAPDHLLASIVGPSLALPHDRRQVLLGVWQRVVLVELDGPRQRTLYLVCL